VLELTSFNNYSFSADAMLSLVTEDEMLSLVTKDEMLSLVTKDEMLSLVTKDEMHCAELELLIDFGL
jgi:hypothetical protein